MHPTPRVTMHPTPSDSGPGAPVIEVEDLVAHYGEREILHGVSMSVRRGEIMVVMGGSGSGKSTLLRRLLGLERPTSGSIRLLGQSRGHELDDLLFESGPGIGTCANRHESCSSAKRRAACKKGSAGFSRCAADDQEMPVRSFMRIVSTRRDQRA